MKKHLYIFTVLFFVLSLTGCETIAALLGSTDHGITNDEAVSAFKAAMNIGAKAASASLSETDGYYKNELLKIMLPDEADVIIDNLANLPGGQRLVDDVILRINRSAEEAAKDVGPIFAQAITEMTVADGLEIVFGEKDACTTYLSNKTYDKLVQMFLPKMQTALNQPIVMGVSANKAWNKLVLAYETVAKPVNMAAKLADRDEPMPPVTADLEQYTTKKALDGLFSKIAAEEAKIRDVPFSYDSQIVQKVFSYVKSQR